ncbi:MAG: SDR family oxidoreductase [Acidimicrobiales bacterium]|jgi:short-subunit dehydrogenase
MDINGRVVVVTGGAAGIGRALCRSFAAAGALGVVVADVDGSGAEKVATALVADGRSAIAVRCDVADESDVIALVAAAEEAYGPVDIFCANAGIVVPGGVEVLDPEWDRIWKINVQSHIYAARAVLPSMLARGEGYLIHTASAAGLLTQLGSAPYAVTKHATVALAEWLSITHGDAGLKVSCLCPQGVWTAMTGAGDDEEDAAGDNLGRDFAVSTAGRDGMMLPAEVAQIVMEAVADERFLILPHPVVAEYEQRRAGDRERWLRGMRKVQGQIVDSLG